MAQDDVRNGTLTPKPSDEVEHLGGDTSDELLPEREPLRRFMRGIGLIEQTIGALLIVVILILVLGQVASRYLPGSWVWTGEVARLSMVWTTFVIAGFLAALDRHIAIHVLDWILDGRRLAAAKLFASLFVLATCLAMMMATYELVATDIGGVTAAAQLPLRYVNMVPIVGFGLVAVRTLMRIVLVDAPGVFGRRESTS